MFLFVEGSFTFLKLARETLQQRKFFVRDSMIDGNIKRRRNSPFVTKEASVRSNLANG
jgi:hypothetical protein